MAFSKLLLLTTLAISVFAAPSRILHGARDSAPRGWTQHRRADPDAVLPLKFTLTQSNVENLDKYLLDVADPRSANYGKLWTPSKVADTFRPSSESVDTVRSWLVNELGMDANTVQLNRNRDTLVLDVTVAQAEEILGAEYFVYSHENGEQRVGCHGGYSLPEHVSKHVDFVWPTVHFRQPLTRRASTPSSGAALAKAQGPRIKEPISAAQLEASGCDQAVTIDCLRDLYDFTYVPVAGDKNSVAVAEWEEEIYQQSDLDLFFKTYEPSLVGSSPELVSVEGGTISPPGDLGEATLDIELVMGLLGPTQNLTLYQVGGPSGSQVPIDELLGALDGSYCALDGVSGQGLTDCGDKSLTHVISMSYHFEPDYVDPAITPIVQRECTEFGKLSLTGTTFVASSGDGGVGYSQAEGCLVNGTLQYFGNGSFVGQFPASCPYVTAVGATSVAPGNSVTDPEIATTFFPSGGGFSNNFPMPSWQQDVVENYLANYVPAYGPDVFNRSGRAYPDVAANGWPIVVAEDGEFFSSGGTSASAPIFAAVVTVINDARIAAGKSPVGFINPTLYSLTGVYNDVTNGTNPACGTEGFVAAPGWDPVTGLGTPNVGKLIDAFLALP